jgi:ABC-type polysaccharide transport system permease subunit
MTYFKMQMNDDVRALRIVVEDTRAFVTNSYDADAGVFNVTLLVVNKNPISWLVSEEQYELFVELWESIHGKEYVM